MKVRLHVAIEIDTEAKTVNVMSEGLGELQIAYGEAAEAALSELMQKTQEGLLLGLKRLNEAPNRG